MKNISDSSKSTTLTLKELRERNQAHIKRHKIKLLGQKELKRAIDKGRAQEAVARSAGK